MELFLNLPISRASVLPAIYYQKVPVGTRGYAGDMAAPEHRWLIACTCGWDREASSAWSATAIASLHARYLTAAGTEHVITIQEPPDEPRDRAKRPLA